MRPPLRETNRLVVGWHRELMLAEVGVGDTQMVVHFRLMPGDGPLGESGLQVSDGLRVMRLRVPCDATPIEQLPVPSVDLQRAAQVRLRPVVQALLKEALRTVGEVEGLGAVRFDGSCEVDHRLRHVAESSPRQAPLAEHRGLLATQVDGPRQVLDGILLPPHAVVHHPAVVVVPALLGLQVDHCIEVQQGRLVVAHVPVHQAPGLVQGFIGRDTAVEGLQRTIVLPIGVVHDAQVKPRGMVARIAAQGLLVAGDGLAHLPAALKRQALVVQVGGVVWLQPDRFRIVFQGLSVVAKLEVGIATIEKHRGGARLRLQGCGEVFSRLLVRLQMVASQATIVQIP
mmetsp:Transcript_62784/g.149937  ORF Transcript_62784/g.149937 Transcript_62784/m.149937 type:complete len:342 (+) Transcript_62784:361-1386(+)